MTKARQTIPAKKVAAELLPEQSPDLLRELHLLTRTGDLNADARRKLKQINHLVGLLRPGLDELFDKFDDPLIVDAGAGNAYLAFVLYELFCKPRGRGRILGVEVRPDLVERARERAARLDFQHLTFINQPVAALVAGERPEIHGVVALHACDTATDDALALGIRSEAKLIAVVPCCQAEVSRLLQGSAGATPPQSRQAALGALWRHPIHRREWASHLTNVVRGLLLEAWGYQVTVTELTGWEHSLKNELILGRKIQRRNGLAVAQLERLLAELPAVPMQLLREPGLPPPREESAPAGP